MGIVSLTSHLATLHLPIRCSDSSGFPWSLEVNPLVCDDSNHAPDQGSVTIAIHMDLICVEHSRHWRQFGIKLLVFKEVICTEVLYMINALEAKNHMLV